MNMTSSYVVLILAVILGVTSNTFAKSAQGFTVIFPSIITAITIVLCMYTLSIVMKNIPVEIKYLTHITKSTSYLLYTFFASPVL